VEQRERLRDGLDLLELIKAQTRLITMTGMAECRPSGNYAGGILPVVRKYAVELLLQPEGLVMTGCGDAQWGRFRHSITHRGQRNSLPLECAPPDTCPVPIRLGPGVIFLVARIKIEGFGD
jgi:hypothetical protein